MEMKDLNGKNVYVAARSLTVKDNDGKPVESSVIFPFGRTLLREFNLIWYTSMIFVKAEFGATMN